MKLIKTVDKLTNRNFVSGILYFIFAIGFTGDLFAVEKSNVRHDQGYEAIKKLDSVAADKVMDSLSGIAPDMGNYIIDFAYGDVYKTDRLDIKSRQIATLAALAALGNAKPQLKWHLGASLNIGITPEEIIEIMYITTVYHGFPAALNAIFTTKELLSEKGITFKPKKSYSGEKRRERGLSTMDASSKGAGQRVINSLSPIAPDIAEFIIDFSYGDIFSRTALSPKHREIVAIAGMCAVGTMRPQLKVHVKAAQNVGLTKTEIIEVMTQMAVYAGFPSSLNGIFAAKEVFNSK